MTVGWVLRWNRWEHSQPFSRPPESFSHARLTMIFISRHPLPVHGVSIALVAPVIVMGSDYGRVNDLLRRKSGNSSGIPPNREYSRSEADTINRRRGVYDICVRMRSIASSKEFLIPFSLLDLSSCAFLVLPLNSLLLSPICNPRSSIFLQFETSSLEIANPNCPQFSSCFSSFNILSGWRIWKHD